jgi:hypothetical protein
LLLKVGTFDQTPVEIRMTIVDSMQADAIRRLIREKLNDGRLPYDSMLVASNQAPPLVTAIRSCAA